MNQAAPSTELTQFIELLQSTASAEKLSRLVLSKYCGEELDLQRITARPVQLRGKANLSFTYSYTTRDITKNYPLDEGIELIRKALGSQFKNANLFGSDCEAQLNFSKKGKALLHQKRIAADVVVQQGHDREKRRFVALERPFLTELGITDRQHHLIPSMSRKWKQINKFVEIFERAFDASRLVENKSVHIVDFGSGKGYLTFAVHDYLRNTRGLATAAVTGVELREELVTLCNDAAHRLGLHGLDFYQGDVRHYTPEQLNVMIALHACDTATDYAIHVGIRSSASIIMCAPCCHKELRPQIEKPEVLRPLLQYGVHLGQEAEMLTDALRALLLEAHGYETQLFEFISLEHTSKNKMILAVKRAQPLDNREVLAQIDALKQFYGIREQTLEKLLRGEQPACSDGSCGC